MPDPVLITTDLDRTLLFSRRATSELGGALPADPVESARASDVAAGLSHAAGEALIAMPGHVRLCVATSRSLARLARLRLPFSVRYSTAANGGVVLVGSAPDAQWAARIARLLAAAAPAAAIRAVFAGSAAAAAGRGGASWLERFGDEDIMYCVAIVDRARLEPGRFASLAARCAELGWEASLTGRKLYAFPAGFGKEHAAGFIADRVANETGARPLWLAAGDAEHDRLMLAAADQAWVPARSELAGASALVPGCRVTRRPGHAAAAQIAREWLAACLSQERRAG